MPKRSIYPARTAGSLMRRVPQVDSTTSIGVAARRLRESGLPLIIVTYNDRYVGTISDRELMRAVRDELAIESEIGTLAIGTPSVAGLHSASEALRTMADEQLGYLVVVDEDSRPVGAVLPTAFLGVTPDPVAPAVVGGMATPLGVYLTSGAVSAGAPKYGLVLTGMAMFSLIAVGQFATLGIESLIGKPSLPVAFALALLPLVLFVVLFRATPLAGIHAAEHMTVNAIERGEPLVPEVVARMPRTHLRCGTNIAVAASLFLLVSQAEWIPYPEVRLILAIFAVLFFWRPLGTAAQYYITTKRPNAKQIESGILAGKKLLEAHQNEGRITPTVPQRIWNSGLLHVISGSFLATGIIYLVGKLLGFDMDVILGV